MFEFNHELTFTRPLQSGRAGNDNMSDKKLVVFVWFVVKISNLTKQA